MSEMQDRLLAYETAEYDYLGIFIEIKKHPLSDNIGDLVPPVALFWYR